MIRVKNFKKKIRVYEGQVFRGCTEYEKEELKEDIFIAESENERVVLWENGTFKIEKI